MADQPTLLIIWHSRTGTARAMAHAALEAAEQAAPGVARMMGAADADEPTMLGAGGYLFCCPENLASMTGEMKAAFDRLYYPLLGAIEGRPYGVMIAAGSDGENAARQIARIATGWRLRQVAEPVIVNMNAQSPEAILAQKQPSAAQLAPAAELGAALAAGLAMGVF